MKNLKGVDLTSLLQAWHRGNQDAFNQVIDLVYDELKSLSKHMLGGERACKPLDTTELVHQMFFSLEKKHGVSWESRGHFFSIAAKAMRRVLIVASRKRKAGRRMGITENIDEEHELGCAFHWDPDMLLLLESSLVKMAEQDPQLVQLVELHLFGGFSEQEIMETMGLSKSTYHRRRRIAKAWLMAELKPN